MSHQPPHDRSDDRPGRAVRAVGTRSAEPAVFQAGDVVAERYRIVRFIARGGMGEVYEAEDLELRERVALKTIRRTSPATSARSSASSARSTSRAR